jgi:hypothetical protein
MRIGRKTVVEKEIRRAQARINEIHQLIARQPSKPLPKRILVGHWRFLRVREDVLRSSIGRQVSMVVEKCNHWVLGKKKNPSSYRAATEVAASDTASSFLSEQGLKPLTQEQYDAAGFPDFFEKKWFKVVTVQRRFGTKNIPFKRYFPQVPAHMLEYGYKPAYMVDEKVTPPDLVGELKRLYDFMWANHGWEKLDGRHADEWDLSLTRTKIRERIRAKEARCHSFEESY